MNSATAAEADRATRSILQAERNVPLSLLAEKHWTGSGFAPAWSWDLAHPLLSLSLSIFLSICIK